GCLEQTSESARKSGPVTENHFSLTLPLQPVWLHGDVRVSSIHYSLLISQPPCSMSRVAPAFRGIAMSACWLVTFAIWTVDVPVTAGLRAEETAKYVQIDTDALQARIRKTGYVSGVAQGTFLDKKSGARDAGFGLHIMDFLMAPGWRQDGYLRDPKIH